MVIPSMIAISSLNKHYSCSSLFYFGFVDGQPWSTCSDRKLRCSSSRVAPHISSAAMKSGMSMQNSIALMVMHIAGISSSLFVSWLCLDIQSAMNSCEPGLCSFIILYWWIHGNILATPVINVLHLS